MNMGMNGKRRKEKNQSMTIKIEKSFVFFQDVSI